MDKRVETPYARAWREFQDSPEGLRVLAGAGLGIPLSQHKYFVNRLQVAFDAGWNARPAVSATGVE
jgi:hypothetical protein